MSTVEDLIRSSLQKLQEISYENEIKLQKISCENEIKLQDSKLIFPKKRDNSKRISEQEARFLFVRELEKQEKFYYSIETPTELSYKFSDKDNKEYQPQIVSVKDGGQSASVDVTLYEKGTDKFERKHLIEFKNNNVDTCKKDFLKLLYDMEGLYNFYINIVDRDNLEKRNTLKSITGKYQDAINELIKDNKNRENRNSILKIILFNINDGDMRIFKDIDIKNDSTKIIENK